MLCAPHPLAANNGLPDPTFDKWDNRAEPHCDPLGGQDIAN
jgi:hypothetical protein